MPFAYLQLHKLHLLLRGVIITKLQEIGVTVSLLRQAASGLGARCSRIGLFSIHTSH